MRAPLIRGFGTATPAHRITQDRAAAQAKTFGAYTGRQMRVLEALYQRSRVKTRGSVLLEPGAQGLRQSFFPAAGHAQDRGPTTRERLERYAQEAPPLARAASERALQAAKASPNDITHLVTVSCTGFSAPGVDIRLTKDLGLPPTVERTHVGFMGCHGALNGLRVAAALAQDPRARVLVCAVELCSLHVRYGWHEDGLVANALFADGAAACVIASSDGAALGLQVRATGSCLVPDSEDAMGWRIGDHGFEMRLDSSVPELIARHLRPWLAGWLSRQGRSIDAVGSWAIHPGGPRIIRSVVAGLGLPEAAADVSRAVLAEHGNMSSPTVLFILQRLQQLGAPMPTVALAFGPGLVAEAALLDEGAGSGRCA